MSWLEERFGVAALAIAALLAVTSCQQRQAGEGEETAAEESAVEPVAPPPAPAAEADTALGAGAELAVTNTMPHEMVVTVRWGDPAAERVLGPVGASETRTFQLLAPPGAAVVVTARDAADTHGVEGAVTATADSAVTFTIQ